MRIGRLLMGGALGAAMTMGAAIGDLTFGRYGGMVQEYYVARFRQAAEERQERLKGMSTRAEAEAYVRQVRERLRRCFGPFPERTPLRARVTGQVVSGRLLIDKVVYESRPGLEVTAGFYRRRDLSGRMPGVLLVLGHDDAGKSCYQDVASRIAVCGYGVLVVDPIGQGERHQFDPGKDGVQGCCAEHNMLGKKLRLLGQNLGMWRLWDAIRGLDYLLARPETDPRHVGVTGCSGGGTMTSFVDAFDPRLTMAAPCCYLTTLLRNLENELPADAEQNPPDFLAQGLDEADLLIAAAPRPTAILAQDNDFFDPRGAREVYRDVRRIYALLGRPDDVRLVIGPGNHGYPVHHQINARDFFNSLTGLTAPDDPVTELPEEKLNCYAPGEKAPKTLQQCLDELADGLRRNRRPLAKTEMAARAIGLLKLETPGVPDYRMYRTGVHDLNQRHLDQETYFDRFGLETEPGIRATLKRLNKGRLLFHPGFAAQAVLFVPHLSTSPELRSLGLGFRPDRELFSCEVRGIGETRPAEPGSVDRDFFQDYGADMLYASGADMLGRPYLGRKVLDLLCAIEFLTAHGVKDLHLIGNGQGAPVAAFAALLAPDKVHKVTLHHAPRSYEDMALRKVCRWPFSCMPPGILEHFDLPDLYRTVQAEVASLADDPSPTSWQ